MEGFITAVISVAGLEDEKLCNVLCIENPFYDRTLSVVGSFLDAIAI